MHFEETFGLTFLEDPIQELSGMVFRACIIGKVHI